MMRRELAILVDHENNGVALVETVYAEAQSVVVKGEVRSKEVCLANK